MEICVWKQVSSEKKKYWESSEGTGGIFALEVQSGWNVHYHGLVFGPERDYKYAHKIWCESVKKNGWRAQWINYRDVYPGKEGYKSSIMELVQYPVKPHKKGRHDEKLLAYVEKALIGKRRFVSKGSWYNEFPDLKEPTYCPVCGGKMFLNFEDQEIFGEVFKKNFFTYDDAGLKHFEESSRLNLIEAYCRGGKNEN